MNYLLQNKMFLYACVGFTIFMLSFVLALILVFLIRKYAVSLRLVDAPGERKIHSQRMPLGGGIGIVFSTILTLICIYGISCYTQTSFSLPYSILSKLQQPQIICLLCCSVFIFVIGLIDDYKNLSPKTKLYAQILAAIILFIFDIRLTIFINNIVISFCATVFWVVFICNSFNLLDNMDGLSSGVAFIIGMILIFVMVTSDQWLIVFMLMALGGSLLGFLYYNFSPATIFMGDSGSLFIGFFLGSLTIYANFYESSFSYFHIALPILVFAVPIFDTTTVVWYRLRSKRPIFKGDTNHFSHRLTKLGLHPKKAVLVIYLVTFATGINATLLYQVDDWIGATIIVIQLIAILFVIHILEHSAIQQSEKNNG